MRADCTPMRFRPRILSVPLCASAVFLAGPRDRGSKGSSSYPIDVLGIRRWNNRTIAICSVSFH